MRKKFDFDAFDAMCEEAAVLNDMTVSEARRLMGDFPGDGPVIERPFRG